ncbi:MAG: glycosyltransferase family 1 protein [Bacteroidota bacterium]
MKIGIDVRVLGSHLKSGIQEYTENLLACMIAGNPEIEFKLFYSGNPSLLEKYSWINLNNVKVIKSPVSNKLIFALSWLFNYPRIDDLIGGVEVFFSPHFLIAPLNSHCRRVTTFHDLSYLRFREFLSLKSAFWHYFQIGSFSQADLPDKIIAVSESTKYDLIDKYSIDPKKIETIYSGISNDIARPSQEELDVFRKKNNLPEKFILFLGKLEPRKNIPALIKAFNLIKDSKDFDDLHLIIVGAKGWLFKDIFNEAEKSSQKAKIIFKDYINDEDKKFYYSLASVFVYASFFEGFGFPPLEAMACGTPVIVSNNSSLPEVMGDAGLLVDPYNAVDISNAIKAVIKDENLRNYLLKKGKERVKMFQWEECANKTLKVILDQKV